MINEATRQFIIEHANDDPGLLALSAKRGTEVDVPLAIQQIKARKAIQHKIPSWHADTNIIYPVQLSVEQCSSEQTATFKASLVSGNTFADLTGGFGVDCAFLSSSFSNGFYVERNNELCRIASQNFKTLGLSGIQVENIDAIEFLQKTNCVDCFYIDPARRDAKGKKTVALSDCEPDVTQLLPLLMQKSGSVLIKTSPMLDISLALTELKQVSEVYVLAVDNECKELLFLLKKGETKEPVITAVNFNNRNEQSRFSFTISEEQTADCLFATEPEKYLYEPNVALLKAGAYKLTAERLSLKKLHPNSHLYTSEVLQTEFPGRIFSIESYFAPNKANIKAHLNHISKANITVRNFPEKVDILRKKLKLQDGGDVYLFATTLFDNSKVVIMGKKV